MYASSSSAPVSFVSRDDVAAAAGLLATEGHHGAIWWAKGAFDITTGDVARLAGRAPRRLIEVAKEYLA